MEKWKRENDGKQQAEVLRCETQNHFVWNAFAGNEFIYKLNVMVYCVCVFGVCVCVSSVAKI